MAPQQIETSMTFPGTPLTVIQRCERPCWRKRSGSGKRKRGKMPSLQAEKPIDGSTSLLYVPTPKQFQFHAGEEYTMSELRFVGVAPGRPFAGYLKTSAGHLIFQAVSAS